ncbi:hypothetical protein ANCDUO_08354 [Ancylostoma duodenale]|uniref:Uncharacterized protein n=1 Tax=Ancylostoma duodenale TaxID=51022 RepID=A0A0C2CWS0_9BILA|nr:hypothetical protein ANCDUO_08354 [Ancylostoma duodenale]
MWEAQMIICSTAVSSIQTSTGQAIALVNGSSGYAQVFATFSVLFVLISISGLVLGSLPELQVPVQKNTSQASRVYSVPRSAMIPCNSGFGMAYQIATFTIVETSAYTT